MFVLKISSFIRLLINTYKSFMNFLYLFKKEITKQSYFQKQIGLVFLFQFYNQ